MPPSEYQQKFSGDPELVAGSIYGVRGFRLLSTIEECRAGKLRGSFSSEPWVRGVNEGRCLAQSLQYEYHDHVVEVTPQYHPRIQDGIRLLAASPSSPLYDTLTELARLHTYARRPAEYELIEKFEQRLVAGTYLPGDTFVCGAHHTFLSDAMTERYTFQLATRLDVPPPLADVRPDCTCGYYAFTNPEHAYSELSLSDICGVIRGTGTATVGTLGFRVQRAEILALWTNSPAYSLTYNDALKVQERYGVPLFVCAEKALRYTMSTFPDSASQLEPLVIPNQIESQMYNRYF